MVKLVGGVVSALVCLGACGSSEEKTDQTGVETGVEESGLETADPQMGHPTCEALELPTMAWNPGPYGMLRHDIADDFDFPVLGGETWSLSANWTGCDVYLFVPDRRTYSGLDSTSIWERDLEELIAGSPLNAHYFFVATASEESAEANLAAMQVRVDEALAGLDEDTRTHWQSRLHVSAVFRTELGGWLSSMLATEAFYYGFGIDRSQGVRLFGNWADVNRYDQALSDAGEWPWEANMSYAAHEARHWNFEALRDARLGDEDVLIVSPWSQEVLGHVVEVDVEFPDEATMAGFDTLEIDLTMDCPDPEAGEFGNCGAWDYLSHIYLQDDEDEEKWHEVARFITTYHREGRYVVDATHLLAEISGGGVRHLKYDISPSWNPQSYMTQMDFRFSNRGKGYRPVALVPLWTGGSLDSNYNDNQADLEVEIPESATRVEFRALLTGHGMAGGNCAEFCNHKHYFQINDSRYKKNHGTVGQAEGCIDEIENGMVPNQGGTWWFGRGGWCPGQQVEPFIENVTTDWVPGEAMELSYEVKIGVADPPDNSGNIVLNSWLVVYE